MHRILKTVFNAFRRSVGNNVNITSEHWGKEAGTWQVGRGIHWTEHQAVQDRINKMVSGDHSRDAYRFLIDFLSKHGMRLPLSRCLTLGCGAGDLERGLAQYNFCIKHDAYDIADGAIKRAKQKATETGLSNISYYVSDINNIALPSDTYDLVFGVQAVHHFSNLEHIFSEVRKALKTGGFFVLNEFVGPTKFQWTDRQLTIINSLLQILPERYRISRSGNSRIETFYTRPTIEEMDRIDPSEAVRSGDIVNVLTTYFNIAVRRDYGGSIIHLLLQDIAGNFKYNDPEDMKLLDMLFDIEDTLMEIGEIASDFAVIIAQKP